MIQKGKEREKEEVSGKREEWEKREKEEERGRRGRKEKKENKFKKGNTVYRSCIALFIERGCLSKTEIDE